MLPILRLLGPAIDFMTIITISLCFQALQPLRPALALRIEIRYATSVCSKQNGSVSNCRPIDGERFRPG